MDQVAVAHLLQQLIFHSPALLVYLIGIALAVVFLRRHPSASILTLLGIGLLIVVMATVAVVQAYLVQRQTDENWSVARYAWLTSLVGIAGSIGRAVGLALVVAAVFVGRGRSVPAGPEPVTAPDPGR